MFCCACIISSNGSVIVSFHVYMSKSSTYIAPIELSDTAYGWFEEEKKRDIE